MTIFTYVALLSFVSSILILPVHTMQNCNRPEMSNELIYPYKRMSPEVIRVVSYNIRGESAADRKHGNTWDTRKYKIQYLLQWYQPDIIGFQGVSKYAMSDIQDLFPEYICIAFDVSDKNKDVALLIRSERLSMEERSYFWLSDDPLNKKIPDHPSWGGHSPRIVLQATLNDLNTGRQFVVLCTHVDSAGMESRINSARVLADQVKKINGSIPILLFGDFNFIITTPVITKKSEEAYALIIQNAGLHDVRDILANNHYGPDGTWIGWPYDKYAVPDGTIGERIDNIFTRHCIVLQEGVLNLKVNMQLTHLISTSHEGFKADAYPSDHLPVIADIIIL